MAQKVPFSHCRGAVTVSISPGERYRSCLDNLFENGVVDELSLPWYVCPEPVVVK